MTDETKKRIRPFKVGEEATYVAGVRGVVDAIADDSITIAGHTLPTRVGGPLVYSSVDLPEGPDECGRAHCADGDCDDDDFCTRDHVDSTAWQAVTGLVQALEDEHDAQLHPGPFRFCRETLCGAAQAVSHG